MRSKHHYFEDSRFVVIKVDFVRFRLPAALLGACCRVLADRLHITSSSPEDGTTPPSPEDGTIPSSPEDGTTPSSSEDCTEFTEGNPLVLTEVSWKEFQSLLDCIFPPFLPTTFYVDDLEAILKVSAIYDAPTARKFAVEKLSACQPDDTVSPARLLGMAVKYRVPKWFVPSYMKVAASPLHMLTSGDLAAIPPRVLQSLLITCHQVYVLRSTLQKHKPPQYRDRTTSAECNGDNCAKSMVAAWDDTVDAKLIHEIWFSPGMLMAELTYRFDRFGKEDLCSRCRSQYQLNFSDILETETRGIEGRAAQAFRNEALDGLPFDGY